MGERQFGMLPGTHFPGYEVVPATAKAGLVIVHGIAELHAVTLTPIQVILRAAKFRQ